MKLGVRRNQAEYSKSISSEIESFNWTPFYASFDIRDSGFKIAPVDANCFPSGWNNVDASDLEKLPQILKKQLKDFLRLLVLNEVFQQSVFLIHSSFCLLSIFVP